jgi:hypothetical protein
MRRTFNFFFTIAALSLVLALLGGCLSSLGSYAEVPEDLRAFLEIESGLEVAFFDDDEVNWKTDSFFDSYAEIAVPSGVHTLRVVTRKEFSDEGTR